MIIYRKVSVVDKYGKVITNDVYSFAEDHNGNLWLGTNQGVLVMYSPYRLFTDGSIYAQEILIPRNDGSGYADPLLGTQVVTRHRGGWSQPEMAGDIRRRCSTWFRKMAWRRSGISIRSNSPLLSDVIMDICVDGVSGEVFFGTDKGIISYKGDALEGEFCLQQCGCLSQSGQGDFRRTGRHQGTGGEHHRKDHRHGWQPGV